MTDEPRTNEERLLDQALVRVDVDSYHHYLDILDQPPSGEGFDRLISAPKPWAEPADPNRPGSRSAR